MGRVLVPSAGYPPGGVGSDPLPVHQFSALLALSKGDTGCAVAIDE